MRREDVKREGVFFFILKLHREADPPARFAKATCGLSAWRVLEKRPNSRFIRADPVKSVLSYTLFVFPPQDAIAETISFYGTLNSTLPAIVLKKIVSIFNVQA